MTEASDGAKSAAARGRSFPDSLVLIFGFVVAAQLLSYVVPQGAFERTTVDGRERPVPGTYAPLETPVVLEPWAFLEAVPEGFAAAQEIIFLVFLTGGVVALMRRTGAIDAGLLTAVRRLDHAPWVLIGGCLLLFSLGAFTIGMGEEYVPLVPILVTMSLAMRMDAIVALGMVWVPYGIGWAAAAINPFGVLIAQDIAGVPPASGWGFRSVMLLVFLGIGFQHVYAYALKVRARPEESLVRDVDYSEGYAPPRDVAFTRRRSLILLLFVAGLAFFVWGAQKYQWYIAELDRVFLGLGLLIALVGGLRPNEASRAFLAGAAEMTSAALIIGFARAIEVVLSEGKILDTLLYAVATPLETAPPDLAALGMLAVQTLTNLFIPSGSGQAFVTMPIMSPLATLTGLPQQTAVLAYQFGDGFTNMLVPTSALVMGTLDLGRVPYAAWFRFCAPLLLKLFAAAIVFLLLSVHFPDALGL
ncbi:MAG: TIGR00366 family protein [Myxococcota bacterium]